MAYRDTTTKKFDRIRPTISSFSVQGTGAIKTGFGGARLRFSFELLGHPPYILYSKQKTCIYRRRFAVEGAGRLRFDLLD